MADLASLAACARLQELVCSYTDIADLSPLAVCTGLRSLICSRTRVSELSPLTACMGLQVLDCSHTRVADLRPLARVLRALYLGDTLDLLAHLGSLLAACPGLQTLRYM